ncbi:MAG: nucleotidyltransferase family protein [Frankiaceae bacterium]|nr:nucleotidyltransferase family protein [Frankiaceae bacterium]MBV9368417.1 nucleotidyltransferase family protein [Frankiales bacterium]
MTGTTTAAALVLAAGAGRRLGRAKALVEFGGELLVDRAVEVAIEAGCDPVVVVLGAQAADVAASASLDHAVVVVNDGWAEGMGSSLRCGLATVRDLGAADVVVLLVDQPHVGAAHVRRLLARRGERPAVVASYGGEPRNPALLAASVWDGVCELAVGDVGARAWMRAHPDDVLAVACDDLGGDLDIDTADDLARLAEGLT